MTQMLVDPALEETGFYDFPHFPKVFVDNNGPLDKIKLLVII